MHMMKAFSQWYISRRSRGRQPGLSSASRSGLSGSFGSASVLAGYRFVFALCLVAGFLATACSSDDDQERPERPDNVDVRPEVIFTIVDDEPMHVYIESQGIVEANQEMLILPRVGGFVAKSYPDDGNYVTKGDTTLFRSDEEWRFQVRQAENAVAEARVEYDIERRQRSGRRGDSRGGSAVSGNTGGGSAVSGNTGNGSAGSGNSNSGSAVSGNSNGGSAGNSSPNGGSTLSENDRMLRNVTGLAQAELELERAQLDLSYSVIKAPFSGHVSVPGRISEGAYIGSGRGLGRLIDDNRVVIRLDVLEAELNRLVRDMVVQITSLDGVQKEGVIRSLSPVVDPERKTGQVLVAVENPNRILKPGMTVEGRVRVQSHSGIVRVPRSAILDRDGGRTLVFKLNEDDQVEWIYVDPEFMTTDWAILNHEDIAPGDTLAVDQHFAISHLQQVRPRMAGEIYRENEGLEP